MALIDTMNKENWSGRVDGDGPEHLRWHQAVRPFSATAESGTALLGFRSDEGVKRNMGRPGAVEGPQSLRQALGGFALPEPISVYDAGDIDTGAELEEGQKEFGDNLSTLLDQGHFTVGLGGGHEITWASFLGVSHFLRAGDASDRSLSGSAKLGIVNLDAHFDNRDAGFATSGTGFFQIAEHEHLAGRDLHYAALGIAEQANTKILFDRAKSENVAVLLDREATIDHKSAVTEFVESFLADLDAVYLTLDLDVLSADVAPGVSAPAAVGVSPHVIEHVIGRVARSGKLLHFDVAELSPKHDIGGRTARTAARMIHRAVIEKQ
ncbi:formimidoylglutamase [Auritidibacter sp. NML100628]|uniref:formimidoylglutamase n=1 Tax=Auritidibacter sp. NML100628 TaxID=2170742 RepID=UPI0018F168E5|nr:formimidoylglutamase [Auritidibacter sp. NML100628]